MCYCGRDHDADKDEATRQGQALDGYVDTLPFTDRDGRFVWHEYLTVTQDEDSRWRACLWRVEAEPDGYIRKSRGWSFWHVRRDEAEAMARAWLDNYQTHRPNGIPPEHWWVWSNQPPDTSTTSTTGENPTGVAVPSDE